MTVVCRKHVRYKAKLRPRVYCLDCWLMYLDKTAKLEEINQEIENLQNQYMDNDQMVVFNALLEWRDKR